MNGQMNTHTHTHTETAADRRTSRVPQALLRVVRGVHHGDGLHLRALPLPGARCHRVFRSASRRSGAGAGVRVGKTRARARLLLASSWLPVSGVRFSPLTFLPRVSLPLGRLPLPAARLPPGCRHEPTAAAAAACAEPILDQVLALRDRRGASAGRLPDHRGANFRLLQTRSISSWLPLWEAASHWRESTPADLRGIILSCLYHSLSPSLTPARAAHLERHRVRQAEEETRELHRWHLRRRAPRQHRVLRRRRVRREDRRGACVFLLRVWARTSDRLGVWLRVCV